MAYATRQRFVDISKFEPFNTEELRSVRLGNGAVTSVKTSIKNICDYVTIDGTRWFVTDYIYLNGSQVQLNLQRDVIGEFGLKNCYGKVERGHTNSFLKYRKELSLNQILKKRVPLIPTEKQYGNLKISTHDGEKWGILYFVKPSGLDPETGEKYPDSVNISIPSFAPRTVDLGFIQDGTINTVNNDVDAYVSVPFVFRHYLSSYYYDYYFTANYRFEINEDRTGYVIESDWTYEGSEQVSLYGGDYSDRVVVSGNPSVGESYYVIADAITDAYGNYLINSVQGTAGYIRHPITIKPIGEEKPSILGYNGKVIFYNQKYYKYSVESYVYDDYGEVNRNDLRLSLTDTFSGKTIRFTLPNGQQGSFSANCTVGANALNLTEIGTVLRRNQQKATYTILTGAEAGEISITTAVNVVDEPFYTLVFPLYDVDLSIVDPDDGDTVKDYSIEGKRAFEVFNTVIQYMSGEKPYLVDAQIYPYCPDVFSVGSEIKHGETGSSYPFFTVVSSSFMRECTVNLYPNSDIKLDYITREYTVVSPDQSGRFTFNFYDYVNEINEVGGENIATMSFLIKTALKPFAIVSSAVIQPTPNSLIGMTYYSDMRGSQPSGAGFECSLSSNAFEEYKRQNSNYQQIFSLQQDELRKQHEVERVNEKTQAVVNTLTQTAFGAIAGAQLGGNWSIGQIAGGVAGGAAAAATVGTMSAIQYNKNEDLRQYEEYLQQQNFDLTIGTIKNIPNSVNRISSFNEIMMQEFWFYVEVYECSDYEIKLAKEFIDRFSYGIGIYGNIYNFIKNGWFVRATLVTSSFPTTLHQIAATDLMGGIYYNE